MAYSTLRAAIQAAIKQNDNEEITGNLLQSVLLSIVNTVGAGYNFAGVATPSTNPGTPDGAMFWIGGKGTYANFGSSVTIAAGYLGIFMWDGSAFTRSVLKLSGGEGVFDVTDYTGNEYANLSAALADIPQEAKAGGMQIRFVQNTDHKYVQYRYMGTSTANADFTNVANWQGIDSEPINGSRNLVESNGVKKSFDDILGVEDNILYSMRIVSTGEIGYYGGYLASKEIPCSPGDSVFVYLPNSAGGYNRMTIWNSNKECILTGSNKYYSLQNIPNGRTIKIDATSYPTAAFIVISFEQAGNENALVAINGKIVFTPLYTNFSLNKRILQDEKTIGLEYVESEKNLSVGNLKINATGTNTSTDCLVTDYIDVKNTSFLRLYFKSDLMIRINQYTENLEFIESNGYFTFGKLNGEKYEYVKVAKPNTRYVRISVLYSQRGYGDSNPITVAAYQKGDFGIIVPRWSALDELLAINEKLDFKVTGYTYTPFIGGWQYTSNNVISQNTQTDRVGICLSLKVGDVVKFDAETGMTALGLLRYNNGVVVDSDWVNEDYTISVEETYYIQAKFSSAVSSEQLYSITILRNADNREIDVTPKYEYDGEKLTVKKNYFTRQVWLNKANFGIDWGAQGFSVLDDEHIVAGTYSGICLVNRLTRNVSKFASELLGGTGHCNTLSKGQIIEGYRYPLVYISTFENFPKRCIIAQVNDDFDSISAVGSINVPNDWTTLGDIIVDVENDKYYLMDIDLPSGSTKWARSSLKLYEFSGIPTSGDTTIDISTARVINDTPIWLPYVQGSIFHDGKLWLCSGMGSAMYPAYLNVFDISGNTTKQTHKVSLSMGEPEDVDILGDKVIIGGASINPTYYLLDFDV